MAAATVTNVRLESAFRGFVTRLMATTSMVAPSMRSPFDGFGVVASGAVAARAKSLSKPRFGVKEARDRIAEFIEGTFSPKNLSELTDYLASKFLGIETRIFDGRTANYLVDKKSRQAVLAASVDFRLGRPTLSKQVGRGLEAEIEARRREATTPERIDARSLRNRAGGTFRSRRDNGSPFVDWDDVAFSAPSIFQDREMTVQGKDVWVGLPYARASADPEWNLRIIAKAKAEGKKLIFPAETRDTVESGRLVPGMPILLREGAVRTKYIDESMTFDAMERAFGVSPFEHFRSIGGRAMPTPGLDGPSEVVSMDSFRKFRKGEKKAPPAKVIASEEVASRCVVKQELDVAGREVMSFLDPLTGDEYPFDPAVAPTGVFPKEDAFGLPVGYVQVKADGGYAHFDRDERSHNPYGPAVVPAAGRGQATYALGGEEMSQAQFRRASIGGAAPVVDPIPVPRAPAPRAEEEEETYGMRRAR